jgi:hypothetical protein
MASNQHSTREREIKLLPQTHSLAVDYSLFIMVAVLVMLERLQKRTGTAPVAFPPPISVGSAFISWFRVYPPPPPENASGNIYIVVFGSTPINLRSRWMTSELRGRNEHGWRDMAPSSRHLCLFGTQWPTCVLLLLILVMQEKS